jgi:hypothetical protein
MNGAVGGYADLAVRTDPTDNGGLFIGRRPGTAPIRYRAVPERGSRRRMLFDATVAGLILLVMVLVAASFWGPIPLAWLWVCGQINYHTGSVFFAIFLAFLGMILTLLAGLALLKRLDHFWILVRRAAGHDQRSGIIGPVFAVAAVIGVSVFTFWLLFVAGLGPTFAPTR